MHPKPQTLNPGPKSETETLNPRVVAMGRLHLLAGRCAPGDRASASVQAGEGLRVQGLGLVGFRV